MESALQMEVLPVAMNTPGNNSHCAEAGRWLHLAATPVFAAMALVTAIAGDDPARMLCQGHGGLSLGSMSLMYVLMAVFHAAPWCRWVALHVAGTGRNIRHPGAAGVHQRR